MDLSLFFMEVRGFDQMARLVVSKGSLPFKGGGCGGRARPSPALHNTLSLLPQGFLEEEKSPTLF